LVLLLLKKRERKAANELLQKLGHAAEAAEARLLSLQWNQTQIERSLEAAAEGGGEGGGKGRRGREKRSTRESERERERETK
jgi:hypothetical protein